MTSRCESGPGRRQGPR